ncbi:MOS1T transposase, partial [Pseudoatta argentina]
MLSNIYGEAAISERMCREWFQRFKNGDFDVEDRHSGGREKVFEDAELEALLDQDSCQNQEELARSLGVTQQAISKRLKVMGMIQKQENWVPYELKPRNVERHLFTCEQLLERQRRKEFLHRIVTGDEKWDHCNNPKRRKLSRALKDKRPQYNERHDKVILQHDNARPHVYHLFRSMAHGLADQYFRPYEEVKNWIDSWIVSKDDQFFRRGIRTLPER